MLENLWLSGTRSVTARPLVALGLFLGSSAHPNTDLRLSDDGPESSSSDQERNPVDRSIFQTGEADGSTSDQSQPQKNQ